jgi:hypothetical protein
MARYTEYGFVGVVTKPYEVGELHRVVAQILREPGQELKLKSDGAGDKTAADGADKEPAGTAETVSANSSAIASTSVPAVNSLR